MWKRSEERRRRRRTNWINPIFPNQGVMLFNDERRMRSQESQWEKSLSFSPFEYLFSNFCCFHPPSLLPPPSRSSSLKESEMNRTEPSSNPSHLVCIRIFHSLHFHSFLSPPRHSMHPFRFFFYYFLVLKRSAQLFSPPFLINSIGQMAVPASLLFE